MKNRFAFALAAASLMLVGQGCAARPSDVAPGARIVPPETPAEDRGDMMEETRESATGTMMEGGQEGDRMKSATATEMEKGQEGDAMESATGAMMEGSKDDKGAMMGDEDAAR